jgi:hypothetical protein
MFGSEDWTLMRGRTERNVDPQLWIASWAIALGFIVSWFALAILIAVSSFKPGNPDGRSMMVPVVIVLNLAVLAALVGRYLA